jgi:hypothetical protein
VNEWKKLYRFLFTKYMDGNIKEARPVPEGYKFMTPTVKQPGYSESFYRNLVNGTGDKFKVIEPAGH